MNRETSEYGARKRTFLFMFAALFIAVAHFIFLISHFAPAISTPDAQAYFVQARLIATEGKTCFQPESPLQYIGPHWNLTKDHCYYCTPAPGLGAILAPAYRILGPQAALLMNPIMASLTLVGLFLLCRLWVGEGWALLAMTLMAFNPFANEHALFGDSHTASCFFLIWALYFLARWAKAYSHWSLFLAGLCAGVIPTIRYAEVLFLPALAIFILFHTSIKNSKKLWGTLAVWAAGVALPVAALAVRNQFAYGAFWRTGYALTKEQAAFAFSFFVRNSPTFLQKLTSEGCGLAFPLGIIGITILCARRETWKMGLLFALLCIPVTILYTSYYWQPDPQSMRFLLPTFYIYTIAAVWVLRQLTRHHRASSWSVSVVLLVLTCWWGLPQSLRKMNHLMEHNAALANITSVLTERVEPGSVIIANQGLNQHLDFIGRWHLVDPSPLRLAQPPPPMADPRSFKASQRGPTLKKPSRARYEGLTGTELFTAFAQDVWDWAGQRQEVYLVAKEEEMAAFKMHFSRFGKLEAVDQILLPDQRKGGREMPDGRPPTAPPREHKGPPDSRTRFRRPRMPGPHCIFDLSLDGAPLYIVKWTRGTQ